MNTLNYFLIIIIGIFQTINCQDTEDFEEWLKRDRTEYKNFQSEYDQKFISFLKKDWEQYTLSTGIVHDSKPKPVEVPITQEKNIPIQNDKLLNLPEEQYRTSRTTNNTPHNDIDLLKTSDQELIEIDFFGKTVLVSIDQKTANIRLVKVNNQNISKYWDSISYLDHNNLFQQLKLYRKNMRLNDWGYFHLLKLISDKIYNDRNTQRAFLWFLLTKSEIDSKIGYSNTNLYLLINTPNTFYGAPYFHLGGNRYFLCPIDNDIQLLSGSIYTYSDDYSNSLRPINMAIIELPLINQVNKIKSLEFTYKGKKQFITAEYDQNLVNYLNIYPQTDVSMFFGCPLSLNCSKSLAKDLKPLIKDKTETEAVNIILRFVQKAFEYATDNEQFSYENFLFAEETIHYKYSDCEDRSILFAYLVKELTGLEVIGLDYPGHIATAVKFTDKQIGDTIKVNEKLYTICDPTYINANIGESMPQFKSVTPGAIIF